MKTRPVRTSPAATEAPPATGGYSVNLASDDPPLRERLLRAAQRHPRLQLYFRASAPQQGGRFAAQLLPARVLIGTPDLRSLRQRGRLLLAYGPGELLSGCFLAGCDDYLKEPWGVDELEWRLRRLLPDPERRYRFPWGEFTLQGLRLSSPRGQCALSWPELHILRLLADHPGQVVSREALYYAIRGDPGTGDSRVADVHASRLRAKLLGLFPASAGALRSARGRGYLLE